MKTLQHFTIGLILFGLVASAQGATIRQMEVERNGEEYRVHFEAVVDIPPDRAFALLTDYDRLERLNPGIIQAEQLKSEEGVARVRTVLEECVAFFCKEMVRVQKVRTSDQRLIRSEVVPEASDFRSGSTRWELAAVTEGTRIRFRTRMVPAFWVPPVVGPWAVKSNLKTDLRALVKRLEQLGSTDPAAP